MIRIDDDDRRRIVRHAESTYPHECCGALLGRADDGVKSVASVVPIDNRRGGEAARRRFLVTAEDYRVVDAQARDQGSDILGFYHSHPDHPARPSTVDRDHALPWYSYVIVSVEDGHGADLTSWVLADDRSAFDEEVVA